MGVTESERLLPHGLRARWSMVGVGVLFTLAWEMTVSGIAIGDRVLQPGMPAYVALMFVTVHTCGASAGSRWHAAWFALSAVALSDLPLMATRSSNVLRLERDLWIGVLFAAVVLLPLAAWASRRAPRTRVTRVEVLICWVVAMASIAGFQWFNRSARAAGVPNEERSLIVAGVEWHHINWGLILLAVAVVARASSDVAARWRRPFAAVLGLAVGMVLDEWYYYMARDVTDDAYFAIETWTSAVALGVVLLFVWLAGAEAREMPVVAGEG